MTKSAWKTVLIGFTLALPLAAAAADGDHWYLNPYVGGFSPDHDRNLKNQDWLYGLGVGHELGPLLNMELNFNGARITDGHGFRSLSPDGGSADVLAVLNRNGILSPYVSLGLGAVKDDFRPGRNQTNFMAQAGVGVMLKLWEDAAKTRSFALRPDVKARWDDPGKGDHLVDYLWTVGFQYSFGGSPLSTAVPPPPPPPVVQAAPPAPVAPLPPADSDQDGVIDSIDKCPETPRGVQVDSVGCPLKGSITLEGVTFEFNSAQLARPSESVLNETATGLKKHPRLKVEIQGYTDNVGAPQYNLKLSQRRAESVREYLVRNGAEATQLVSKGFGLEQPVASNSTAEGRAKNRRVVMFVLSNPGEVKVEGQGTTAQ